MFDDCTRKLVRESRDGIIIAASDGRVIEWNNGSEQITGIARADAIGRLLWEIQYELMPPEKRSAEFLVVARDAMMRGLTEGPRLTRVLEDEIQLADGTRKIVQSSVFAIESDGELLACGICRDITAQRQVDAELRLARRMAEDARIAAEAASSARDRFIAMLSHELRNPLNAILAMASHVCSDSALTGEMRSNWELILRNALVEARLMDDLLDMTRIDHGKMELDRRPVQLSSIVERAVEVCRTDLDKRRLKLSVGLPEGACWLDADAVRLQQAFWNLLKNAIKFTPEGGAIEIRGRVEDSTVELQFVDDGLGIDASELGRIFEPFQQGGHANGRLGGLGLGLPITRGIVELHGGTIVARSEGRGRGAAFTVCLPVATSHGRVNRGSDTRPAEPVLAGEPLRILFVDDHEDTARIMRRILSAAGHQVHVACGVDSALAYAQTHELDLLLSDLGLPDGSGHDLLRRLRERGQKMPAIVLSGMGQPQDLAESRAAGYAEHLTKPVDIEALYAAIRRVCHPTLAPVSTDAAGA